MHIVPVGSLNALLETLDLRRPAAAAHSRRVAAYAGHLATIVGLPDDEARALMQAALVHEAGTLVGPGIAVTDIPGFGTWCGLDGEVAEILWYAVRPFHRHRHAPVAARLLAVAHFFDQLAAPHEYRTPMPAESARLAIAREAGRRFCPVAVNALNAIRLERLDDGSGAGLVGAGRPDGPADGAAGRLTTARRWQSDQRFVTSS